MIQAVPMFIFTTLTRCRRLWTTATKSLGRSAIYAPASIENTFSLGHASNLRVRLARLWRLGRQKLGGASSSMRNLAPNLCTMLQRMWIHRIGGSYAPRERARHFVRTSSRLRSSSLFTMSQAAPLSCYKGQFRDAIRAIDLHISLPHIRCYRSTYGSV